MIQHTVPEISLGCEILKYRYAPDTLTNKKILQKSKPYIFNMICPKDKCVVEKATTLIIEVRAVLLDLCRDLP